MENVRDSGLEKEDKKTWCFYGLLCFFLSAASGSILLTEQ